MQEALFTVSKPEDFVPTDHPPRALLIQVLFSVRSERQLMEQVCHTLLYRWSIGLAIDDEVWDHFSFSKYRDCLLEHAVVEHCFTEVMDLPDKRNLLSREHFSMDGALVQALGQPLELRAQGWHQ